MVGAGIAGSEIAYRCAGAGIDTLLITTSLDTVCNLAGPGATLTPPPGTLLQRLHEETADRDGHSTTPDLHRAAKRALESVPALHLLQSNVDALALRGRRVEAVQTWEGVPRRGERVVLCVGSFLRPRLRLGIVTETAGRLGEMGYDDLYHDLVRHGFRFDDLLLEAPAAAGRPEHRVHCKIFHPDEIGSDGRLERIDGLYAAGLCRAGEQSYETTAQQAHALAAALIGQIEG